MRPLRRAFLALGISAVVAALVAGCGKQTPLGGEQAQTEVYVLVDLSETWHDPAQAAKEAVNRQLLQEVGEGIALVAEDAEPPVLIQHRIIGANALNRQPACSVTYMPTLVATRRDNTRLSSLKKLRAYIGVDCPRVLLAGPAEAVTEISAAIASVATRPKPPGANRFIVIASDFKEEAVSPEPLSPGSLTGTKVLLLYRPVPEDRRNGGEMQARVQTWRKLLENLGASVSAAPDAGYGRTDLVAFLRGS